MAIQIAVCGPRHCTDQDYKNAHRIGELLAQHQVTVLCGGGIGVMEAAAAGAQSKGGLVIGIRPDAKPANANSHLSAIIYAKMGEARNNILVNSANAVIVVGGSWGTLSELALANRANIPTVSIGGWSLTDARGNHVEASETVGTPAEVVEAALRLAQSGRQNANQALGEN